MGTVCSYSAYGLQISSALPLPELPRSDAPGADVRIRFGDLHPPELSPGQPAAAFLPDRDEAYLAWDQVGTFLVRKGREVVIDPAPEAPEQLLRLPLLGTALAFLLYQRGTFVLHGSAVARGGQVIGFVGEKGQGKSTLAAALYRHGYELVADDLIALSFDDQGTPLVIPGFPQIKLWPDAARASLGEDPDRLPLLAEGFDKRARPVRERFVRRPLPLRRIYVLAAGPAVRARALPPQEAFAHLLAHTYVARYGPAVFTGAVAADHLHRVGRLLRSAGVYALERPRDLALLEAAAQALEERHDGFAAGAPAR